MEEKQFKEWLETANISGRTLVSNLADSIINRFETQNYSKRELDEQFKNLNEKLDKVLEKQDETNGSIMSLRLWRSYITGGLAVLTISIALIVYIWDTSINDLKSKQDKLVNSLNQYYKEIRQ